MLPTTQTSRPSLFSGFTRPGNLFAFESESEKTYLIASGFTEFEDFWKLPKEFVDPVNYRRGGWSGVSKLVLGSGSKARHYFVKQQENQFRYSFRRPRGALTYHYEIEAIRRNQILDLPRVDIAGWGMRKAGANHQGMIISREIEYPSLSRVNAEQYQCQWEGLEPILEKAGRSLFNMHGHRIQHGALFPDHFFIDLSSGQIQLIDFERSRIRRSVHGAIAGDLQQLIKRLAHMPEFPLHALLAPYMPRYEGLIRALIQKYGKYP